MLLRFDKMLYSNLDNENSGESDIKYSRGPHLPGSRRFPIPYLEIQRS